MKNLPNNIYLIFGDITKEEFEAADYEEFKKLDEYAVTFCENEVFDNDVEYVKKDVFIEKACEFISLNVADYIDVTHKGGIEHLVLQERFIDEFKNYMKGE